MNMKQKILASLIFLVCFFAGVTKHSNQPPTENDKPIHASLLHTVLLYFFVVLLFGCIFGELVVVFETQFCIWIPISTHFVGLKPHCILINMMLHYMMLLPPLFFFCCYTRAAAFLIPLISSHIQPPISSLINKYQLQVFVCNFLHK